MAIEIYWGSGSGPAWRVLLGLAIKNVPYESHLMSFSKGDHKAPAFQAISARGKVPAMRDGAFTLYESLAILAYVDRKHPATPLFGVTPEEAGTILRIVMEHECYGEPALAAFGRPLLFGKLDEKREDVVRAIEPMRAELARLEAELAGKEWLAGASVSAADAFVFPALKTLERAVGKPGGDGLDHGVAPLAKAYPKLAAWVARVEAIPGYDATYPPHWREG